MKCAKAFFVVSFVSLSISSTPNPRNDISQGKEADSMSAATADSGGQTWSGRHLAKPIALAVDQQNNLYVSVEEKWLVYKIDTSGGMTVIAGRGKPGRPLVGQAATSVSVKPLALAVDNEGILYLSEAGSFRVCKISPTGELIAVAGKGDGKEGYSGDGGPALTAALYHTEGLAVGPAGEVFILDGENNRIRKVGPNGVITTIAGTGAKDYGGDGGPAPSAHFNWPSAIAVDRAGSLFVADTFNFRVRKIDNAGIITTVAGTGTSGYNVDGILATKAWLDQPESVAVDDKGNLFIADGRIRRVDKQGIITTVGGVVSGKGLVNNEGALATKVILNEPYAVTVDRRGNVYVADWAVKYSKTRVSKIDEAGIITTVFLDTATFTAGE